MSAEGYAAGWWGIIAGLAVLAIIFVVGGGLKDVSDWIDRVIIGKVWKGYNEKVPYGIRAVVHWGVLFPLYLGLLVLVFYYSN